MAEIGVDLAIVDTNLNLNMTPLMLDDVSVRQNGEEAIQDVFLSHNLPMCIEDVCYYHSRATKKLTNAQHGNYAMLKAYQYNANAESPSEKLNYEFNCWEHGNDCCKQECIKNSYLRNQDRITKIFTVVSTNLQWLWPFCNKCNVWICKTCFNTCIDACLPIELILINRDRNQCNCFFRRICTAHLTRFNGFFVNIKIPQCPQLFSSKRSNNPLQEWSGLPSDKRFVELEDEESRNIHITL